MGVIIHPASGPQIPHRPGPLDDQQGMNTSTDATSTTYADIVATLLETDDLPQFWD